MNNLALELFLEGFKIRGKTALTGIYVGFGDGNFFLELYFNLKRTVHVFPCLSWNTQPEFLLSECSKFQHRHALFIHK